MNHALSIILFTSFLVGVAVAQPSIAPPIQPDAGAVNEFNTTHVSVVFVDAQLLPNMERPPGDGHCVPDELASLQAVWHFNNSNSHIYSNLEDALMKSQARRERADWDSVGARFGDDGTLPAGDTLRLVRALNDSAANNARVPVTVEEALTALDLELSAELVATEFCDQLGKSFEVPDSPEASFVELFGKWVAAKRIENGGERVG